MFFFHLAMMLHYLDFEEICLVLIKVTQKFVNIAAKIFIHCQTNCTPNDILLTYYFILFLFLHRTTSIVCYNVSTLSPLCLTFIKEGVFLKIYLNKYLSL